MAARRLCTGPTGEARGLGAFLPEAQRPPALQRLFRAAPRGGGVPWDRAAALHLPRPGEAVRRSPWAVCRRLCRGRVEESGWRRGSAPRGSVGPLSLLYWVPAPTGSRGGRWSRECPRRRVSGLLR
ncbi:hypothetical protein NDU88_005677 [Pleurodeles waltl]|uniref:Uncharacterized protein n=1 Tax=Pleurodeles waltl TaxID=8319 RepID=A0AAV7RLR1_PLEWA|nr:hypothetical protein NDU88_005677 [Pleurodeles waltl]